jgi:hypothetical protein
MAAFFMTIFTNRSSSPENTSGSGASQSDHVLDARDFTTVCWLQPHANLLRHSTTYRRILRGRWLHAAGLYYCHRDLVTQTISRATP